MNKVIVSIGSNSPDRGVRVDAAVGRLCEVLSECRVSDIYETPEYSGRYPAYYNCVVEGFTSLDIKSLEILLKDYERSAGRCAESKLTGIVPIDLDVVEYGGEILRPVEFDREYFAIGYRQLHNKE